MNIKGGPEILTGDDFVRIIRECYWDSLMTPGEILEMARSNDFRLKKKLFSRIMHNSRDKGKVLLGLFDRETLIELFDDFTPSYNVRYIQKHVLTLRNILLGENNRVPGLEWKKR